MPKKKKRSKPKQLKVELFLSGLVDSLQEKPFPVEGRCSKEILRDIEHPISEESFDLGLKTSYDHVLSYISQRRSSSPGYLFTDPMFPPNESVLVRREKMEEIFWKRPFEMSKNPKLFADTPHRYDVIQGEIGDSYLLTSCSAISMRPDLLEKVIPVDQTLNKEDPEYSGLFRVCIWRFGEWEEVIIDDWLPTKDGKKPVYARSAHPDEFWVALVEKGYANEIDQEEFDRLHGSYDAICGGFNADALADLTGGMAVYHDLQKDSPKETQEFFQVIFKSVRHRSFVCCDMEKDFNTVTNDGKDDVTGMIVHHAYTVTGAREIKLKNGKLESLVRMQNPWGHVMEWKNDLTENSNKWENIKKATLRKLSYRASDNGEWWMTYDEFRKYFRHVTICNLGQESNRIGESLSERWFVVSMKGMWTPRENAGGCGNNIFKYARNPQIMFKLSKPDSISIAHGEKPLKECHVLIGLMQEYRKMEEERELPTLPIGLRVYKIKRGKCQKLSRRILGSPTNVALESTVYKEQREVYLTGSLRPGYYVIVPSTFYPDESTSYLIRIFAEKNIFAKELF